MSRSDSNGYHERTLLDRITLLVDSDWFHKFSCFVLLLNCVILGVETNNAANSANGSAQDASSDLFVKVLNVAETIFCMYFLLELFLRIIAHRVEFFFGLDWAWNLYDLIVVALQVLEQL